METALTHHNTRLVVLGNDRYPQRRIRFLDNLRKNGGLLNDLKLDYIVGKPHFQRFPPPSFTRLHKRAHYWAVCCDHMEAMESTLAMTTDYLLLFEDDAHFPEDFDTRFRQEIAALPIGWLALRMGWNGDISSGMIATLWSRVGLLRAYDYFWQHRDKIIDLAFTDLRQQAPDGWCHTRKRVVVEAPQAKQCGRDQ